MHVATNKLKKQFLFFWRRTCKNKIDKNPSHHRQYIIQKSSICRSMALNKSSISAETLPTNLYQRTFLAISIMHCSHNQKQFLLFYFIFCDEHAKARLIGTQPRSPSVQQCTHTHMCVHPIISSRWHILHRYHTWTVHRHGR